MLAAQTRLVPDGRVSTLADAMALVGDAADSSEGMISRM
jgi:hypothetical protein